MHLADLTVKRNKDKAKGADTVAMTTKSRFDAVTIIGVLGGILGGIWLIIWPFITWPPGVPTISIWERDQAAGMRDIIYGVLLILFTFGCLYGFNIGSGILGRLSLYGFALLSIALLVLPFVFGYNPTLFGSIPAGKNQDMYIFWNDIITGIISLAITLYFLIPRKPKVAAMLGKYRR